MSLRKLFWTVTWLWMMAVSACLAGCDTNLQTFPVQTQTPADRKSTDQPTPQTILAPSSIVIATQNSTASPAVAVVSPSPSPKWTPTHTSKPTPPSLPAGELVFVQWPDVGLAEAGIYTIQLPDGKPTLVASREHPERTIQNHPSWSPDGKWIVFAADELISSGQPMGQFDLYIVGSDGKGLRRLTFGGYSDQPTWSPDGRWIVYSARGHIVRIHPDGTGAEVWISHAGANFFPTWSPDGNFLAYLSMQGSVGLRVFEVKSQHNYLLLENIENNLFEGSLSWSSDSQWIYVRKEGACTPFIAVQNREHGEVKEFRVPNDLVRGLSWSPDGKWVSYTGSSTELNLKCIDGRLSQGFHPHLFIAPADGSYAMEILDPSQFAPLQPSWNPKK